MGYDKLNAESSGGQPQTQSLNSQTINQIDHRRGLTSAPLTGAQKRFWILQQLEPENPVFNRPLALRVTGNLDLGVLTRSLGEIVKRHEALRTIFPERFGEPLQIVNPPEIINLDIIIDLQQLDSAYRENEARRLAATHVRRVFSLREGPLFRVVLLRLSKKDHVLLMIMHHIVFDGWSETVLLREFAVLYEAFSSEKAAALPELKIQYSTFAILQQEQFREASFEVQLNYWRRQLAGLTSAFALPSDHPRKQSLNYQANRHTYWLSTALRDQLKEFSLRQQVTLFMTLLAAFQVLLRSYAGNDDAVVGVPSAGRTRLETENLIGCFMNMLVMRTNLSGNPSFRVLLGRVREVALQAYANQDVPFEKIIEFLKPERNLTRWPLFQVMFHLRNLPRIKPMKAGNVTIEPFPFDSGMIGGLELSLEVQDVPDGLCCVFVYAADMQTSIIERMGEQFRMILEAVIVDSERQIDTLTFFTERDRHKLLSEWNDTDCVYSQDKCLHQLFEEQVVRTPDAVAVVFQDQLLTYSELNTRANQLAHYLIKLGVGPDVIVAICIERSLEMLVGLLAILKAGGAYVPLDPVYPKEHLAFMLEDARTNLILTQSPFLKYIATVNARAILLDAELEVLIANEKIRNPDVRIYPDNLAYVIYTSGSTGRPKGVMVCHRGICNYLQWRHDYFPLTDADRLLQKASFSFDDSVWEFFEPLMVGARLVLAQPGAQGDPSYLTRVIEEQKITAVSFVPSMLRVFLKEDKLQQCKTLRRVTTGGETLSVDMQESFFKLLDADLYNGYGATEATIASTFWACKKSQIQSVVPIGRPIANTKIYLLNSRLEPVPIGVQGELYIGGAGLARGYLNNPDLTAARFIPNPFNTMSGSVIYKTGDLARYQSDGTIEFLGRIDDQVKIRGYRIELGEIEAVLRTHPAIDSAVVVVQEDEPETKHLVVFLVAEEKVKFDAAELRNFLKNKLPEYMIPSTFISLNEFPITPTGKVDRKALQFYDISNRNNGQTFVAPRTLTEEMLAQMWAEVLKVDRVGIADNFFDLGGNSLLGMQLVARLRGKFRGDLGLRMLFEKPTVAELAEYIAEIDAKDVTHQDLKRLLTEIESLSEQDAMELREKNKAGD